MTSLVEVIDSPAAVVEVTSVASGDVVFASEVASPFAVIAQAAASDAQAARDEFRGVFYGAFASAPATDPLGNPPDAGDLYYDTVTKALMAWDGTQWTPYSPFIAHTHPWSDVTSTPTTLAGYGISDAVPQNRQVLVGTGLSGGGDLSSDRTIDAVTLPPADWKAGSLGTEAVISPAKLEEAIQSLTPFGGDVLFDTTLAANAVEFIIDLASYPGYDRYRLDVFNIRFTADATAALYMSEDGGVTWDTGNYSIRVFRETVYAGRAYVQPWWETIYADAANYPPGHGSVYFSKPGTIGARTIVGFTFVHSMIGNTIGWTGNAILPGTYKIMGSSGDIVAGARFRLVGMNWS